MLRSPVIILLLALALRCLGQTDSTRAGLSGGGAQFGGQLLVGGYVEGAYRLNDRLLISGVVGIGRNNFGEEERDEPSINALPFVEAGLSARLFRGMYVVAGAGPALYHYRPIWFTNVNGWFGIRNISKGGFSINVGYSPRLYTSFSDPTEHYLDAFFGIRLGTLF
jgi:hypothetical protein